MTDTKGKKNDYEKTLLNLQVELVKMQDEVYIYSGAIV